jgi:hypothetical protein
LPMLIPSTAPHLSLSFGAGTIGQIVADVPNSKKLKKKKLMVQLSGHEAQLIQAPRRRVLWQNNSRSASQEETDLLCRVHRSPPLVPIQSHMKPVHIHIS